LFSASIVFRYNVCKYDNHAKIMGLTIWRVLEYFSVDDMKFALSLINEPQTGNRSILTERLVMEWFEHSKSLQVLLDILERPILANICQDYNIDHLGNKELLIRRLKKELDGDKPSNCRSTCIFHHKFSQKSHLMTIFFNLHHLLNCDIHGLFKNCT